MIRVLIVDDSAVFRRILTGGLSRYKDIEVIGSAIDPYMARDMIVKLRPDVITLDLEMPRMDGLSFLTKLMKYHPMPVVVVSSLTPKNSEPALRALRLGAVEVLCKPTSEPDSPHNLRRLVHAIRGAASARVDLQQDKPESPASPGSRPFTPMETDKKVIAIGASIGGTQAVETVLRGLPASSPGIVIVQHMPENFIATFAERLDHVCAMEVREAKDNDNVVPGVALLAPGNNHMLLRRRGTQYRVKIKDGPYVHYQRPSVDVLFLSVAQHAGPDAVGVLLTGMGKDGAKGLLAIHQSGGHTLAQDEQSCTVFGMPKEAIKLGAADQVVPLNKIADAVTRSLVDDVRKKTRLPGAAASPLE